MKLRGYQMEALVSIETRRVAGVDRQLVSLPTGAGKTVVFSELIRRRGGSALVLAHRDELLGQAAAKLNRVAPELGMSVGFVQASRNDVGAPIVIASVQTLARQNRLDQLPDHFDTVIVDEAHHATAASYRRIIDAIDTPLLVGFTATAERADRDRLEDVFAEIVYHRGIEQMIREGYLCDLRGIRVELEDLDLSKVKRSRGDYQAEDLDEAMRAADAVEHVVGAYAEHAAERKAIVFAPTVALAGEICAAFNADGVPAGVVSGKTPSEERRDLLARFGSGEIRALANVGVLTEGFDEPSVDCVIVAVPTKSRIRYVQMIGRGLRIHPGKHDCLVLDLAGASSELSLSIDGVFGLKKVEPTETITEAIDRETEEAARSEDAEKRRRAREAKRRSKEFAFFDRDRINWLRFNGRWATSVGEGVYLVLDEVARGRWRVLEVAANTATVKARNLDLGYAQGIAEERLRTSGAMLADREARWRAGAVSDGQQKFARRLGVDLEGAKTKGEASDRIGLAVIRERMGRVDRAEKRNNPDDNAAAVAA